MWAYPDLDLVTHGYGDTFTDDEIQRNVDIFSLEPGWDEMVEETGADASRSCVPRARWPTPWRHQLGWEVVQREDDAVALLRAP